MKRLDFFKTIAGSALAGLFCKTAQASPENLTERCRQIERAIYQKRPYLHFPATPEKPIRITALSQVGMSAVQRVRVAYFNVHESDCAGGKLVYAFTASVVDNKEEVVHAYITGTDPYECLSDLTTKLKNRGYV